MGLLFAFAHTTITADLQTAFNRQTYIYFLHRHPTRTPNIKFVTVKIETKCRTLNLQLNFKC